MKRYLLMFFLILSVFGFGSCFWEDEEDPADTTTTLTVNVTYNGPTETADSTLGKVYLYLIPDGTITDNTPPVYASPSALSVCTSGKVTLGQSYTLTIENIAAGNYKVFIFYDYFKQTTREAGKTDKYILYDSTDTTSYAVECLASATVLSIEEGDDVELPDIILTDAYQLGPTDAQFQTSCTK